MDNQPILSLCIPTNGAVQWILPVLDSIYNQKYDLSKFEVVITDNGKDSQLARYLKDYDYPNLRYRVTTDEGFLNLVSSLKDGRGLFCKMINHRSVLEYGTIEEMIELVNRYKDSQPIIYCSDGNVKGPEMIECRNMDQFIANLSYRASWSAGIGFWRKDIEKIDSVELDTMFPNASLLLNLRKESQYVIWNKKYEQMGDDAGKGGYDLYYTFSVIFLDLINGLRERGCISLSTFVKVKSDLFGFLRGLYLNEVILPSNHTFILQNIPQSMDVYYGRIYYWKMVSGAWLRLPKIIVRRFLFRPIIDIFNYFRRRL